MQNIKQTGSARRARGLTLVECLCTVSILATSLGMALPSLQKWQGRQALLSAASELETDVQYARSLSVAQNRPIHLTVRSAAGGTCYVIHAGEPEDCTCSIGGGPLCTAHATTWRHAAYPATGAVKLLHRDTALTFNPGQGTVTPTATFKLKVAEVGTVHQIVSIMGRTRSCSPDGVLRTRACKS